MSHAVSMVPHSNLSDAWLTLRSLGWVTLSNYSRQTPTLDLARALGEPVRSPSGEFARNLIPIENGEAIPGSFSHKFGKGEFPLHTDTAFWPVPARYLVFRAIGDTRRKTLIAPVAQVIPRGLAQKVRASVWIIRCRRPFYCSMQFQQLGEVGFRYDPMIMQPANLSAMSVGCSFSSALAQFPSIPVDWTIAGTVIIDNWRVLHGRGPAPCGEGPRVLERVYVR